MLAAVISSSAVAQTDAGATARYRGRTTASKADYATGHGGLHRNPSNYDAYYYLNSINGYALSPYLLTTPQNLPRVLGPVRPYSDVEYGQLVSTVLSANNVAPAGMSSSDIQSIVQDTGDVLFGEHRYRPVETKVLDVMDRGVMIVGSREEVRLRGLRIGSERNTDDVTRTYAREAMKRIRELTQDQTVTLLLDSPLRDSDGAILAVAKMKDGTELNRQLVKEGLAQFNAGDFAPDIDYRPLMDAEQNARTNKRGIWSRNYTQNGF
jgi:endonuclease YncB( thermonuclease family)